MNIYGRQVKQLLNCSDKYAEFIVAEMAADGLDFSECSQEEFEEFAKFQDSLVVSGFKIVDKEEI